MSKLAYLRNGANIWFSLLFLSFSATKQGAINIQTNKCIIKNKFNPNSTYSGIDASQEYRSAYTQPQAASHHHRSSTQSNSQVFYVSASQRPMLRPATQNSTIITHETLKNRNPKNPKTKIKQKQKQVLHDKRGQSSTANCLGSGQANFVNFFTAIHLRFWRRPL